MLFGKWAINQTNIWKGNLKRAVVGNRPHIDYERNYTRVSNSDPCTAQRDRKPLHALDSTQHSHDMISSSEFGCCEQISPNLSHTFPALFWTAVPKSVLINEWAVLCLCHFGMFWYYFDYGFVAICCHLWCCLILFRYVSMFCFFEDLWSVRFRFWVSPGASQPGRSLGA